LDPTDATNFKETVFEKHFMLMWRMKSLAYVMREELRRTPLDQACGPPTDALESVTTTIHRFLQLPLPDLGQFTLSSGGLSGRMPSGGPASAHAPLELVFPAKYPPDETIARERDWASHANPVPNTIYTPAYPNNPGFDRAVVLRTSTATPSNILVLLQFKYTNPHMGDKPMGNVEILASYRKSISHPTFGPTVQKFADDGRLCLVMVMFNEGTAALGTDQLKSRVRSKKKDDDSKEYREEVLPRLVVMKREDILRFLGPSFSQRPQYLSERSAKSSPASQPTPP
jgi:hypothetical protein